MTSLVIDAFGVRVSHRTLRPEGSTLSISYLRDVLSLFLPPELFSMKIMAVARVLRRLS